MLKPLSCVACADGPVGEALHDKRKTTKLWHQTLPSFPITQYPHKEPSKYPLQYLLCGYPLARFFPHFLLVRQGMARCCMP
jgi:hypothetical protein